MYTRMMIMEAVSDNDVREITNLLKEHIPVVSVFEGFSSAQSQSEEAGHLVVFQTHWLTREDCTRYHTTIHYRRLVNAVDHCLIGNPMMKMFTTVFLAADTVKAGAQ